LKKQFCNDFSIHEIKERAVNRAANIDCLVEEIVELLFKVMNRVRGGKTGGWMVGPSQPAHRLMLRLEPVVRDRWLDGKSDGATGR
jgi:hypothetical protein